MLVGCVKEIIWVVCGVKNKLVSAIGDILLSQDTPVMIENEIKLNNARASVQES